MPHDLHQQLIDPDWARSVRKIAVFRALYLGDLLCATPALRALRQRFASAEITLIGLPWAAELVGRLPFVDQLLEFPGYPGIAEVPYQPERTTAFLEMVRAERYDLVIQLHGDGHVSNGFVADLGGQVALGYRRGADDRLHHSLPYVPDEHETRRWLRLVAELGARSTDTRLVLPTTAADRAQAATLISDRGSSTGPLIGIHTGAKEAARRWPPERFAALADALVEHFDARIVLTGSAAEQSLTLAVQEAMQAPVVNVAGQTDLGVFAALLAQLDLIVTNDTGASHVAAAAGTPSVVLFGPTRPERWAPLNRERHHVVDAQKLIPGVAPELVLAQLPVDAVLEACNAPLIERGHRARGNMGKQINGGNVVVGM